MRLRPSGTQGPVASSLDSFRRYHNEAAWTWEQMSLTRARAVAGPAELVQKVGAAALAVLMRPRDPARLVVEVDDMRRRLAEQHRTPGAFDFKHRRGGMVDIEFVAQYVQLRDRDALRQNTQAAIAASRLPPEVKHDLAASLTLWRELQGLLKLTLDEPIADDVAAPAVAALVGESVPVLLARIDRAAAAALAWYERLIAAPAAAARLKFPQANDVERAP
jgi:glutamate-ammonia-ligase adenylyltransferase